MTFECPDCLEHAGNWCLPDSANFAFAIHTLGNGIKFAQLQKLRLKMEARLKFIFLYSAIYFAVK